jgi:hypothetical protein
VKRLFIVLSISLLAALGVNTGVAGASKPANQACVGKSLSTLASNQPVPGAFGQAVSGFARDPMLPSLGVELQNLQAGVIPDEIVPNTCND